MSTSHELIDLVEGIMSSIDAKEFSIGLFIGSILGSKLLILYISDICNASPSLFY